MMLAETAAQMEDKAAIDQYLQNLVPLVDRDDHRPYRAVAHRARGVSYRIGGEFDLAESSLQQALELFEELDTDWQIGRTYTELAKLDEDRADEKAAYNNYLKALSYFEKIQALPDMKRTRAALESVESAT
jgi:tetratricopeptide (TPR) repeat protein